VGMSVYISVTFIWLYKQLDPRSDAVVGVDTAEDCSASADAAVRGQSYGQHLSNMQIHLAPSETKPFTRSATCYRLFFAVIFRIVYNFCLSEAWLSVK